MLKFKFSDQFIESYAGQPVVDLHKAVVRKELHFQIGRYGHPVYAFADQLYVPKFLYASLLQQGLDVKGNEDNFSVYFDKIRLVFGAHFCQIEGLVDHDYPRFKLDQFSVDGLTEFVKQFPAILSVVQEDMVEIAAKCDELYINKLRNEKQKNFSLKTSKILLDDFLKKRNYKYTIKDEGAFILISANLPGKRRLEFKVEATKFISDFSDILNYLTRLFELVKEQPFPFKIK
ncbi:MAG: hypothetical protein MJZ02_05235 [Paludibacteraceae bacterium]|nr:hypothetical protein [Paludibacteraceae bacterium]